MSKLTRGMATILIFGIIYQKFPDFQDHLEPLRWSPSNPPGVADMAQDPHHARKSIGDIAPKLAELTDEVLFADVWARTELSPRERSLATVAALVALNRTEQLPFHLDRARENGLAEAELVELITHLAFYAGWPCAVSAIGVLRRARG
jgi:4-carboxymuconolactone decarboxylase